MDKNSKTYWIYSILKLSQSISHPSSQKWIRFRRNFVWKGFLYSFTFSFLCYWLFLLLCPELPDWFYRERVMMWWKLPNLESVTVNNLNVNILTINNSQYKIGFVIESTHIKFYQKLYPNREMEVVLSCAYFYLAFFAKQLNKKISKARRDSLNDQLYSKVYHCT